jgi:glutamyl-tRNA synthetase
MKPRVRFAPSPTGHLHIGGARTAIYNWAFARHLGGDFVLRIDDTDPERSTEENVEAILRAMRWLGLDWDEGPEVGGDHGPYYQTQRVGSYGPALDKLRDSGHSYPCFCSPEVLESKRAAARESGGFAGYDKTCRHLPAEEVAERISAGEPHVWRVKVPEDRGDIVITDVIRGEVSWPGDMMDDFIVVRTDGTATYNFATVVDDWQMGMTHIIRGDDHLSNTPRQIVVYEALGAPVPEFAHMSLIFGSDGKRLSKRHGATSVEAYAEEGILPEALLNYLALLGWSLDEETVFSRETLVERFDLSRVSKNPVVWDPEKLEWMNGVYLRQMPTEDFVALVRDQVKAADLVDAYAETHDEAWWSDVAPLVAERVKRVTEIVPWISFFFTEDLEIDEKSYQKVLAKEGAGAGLEAAREVLAELQDFSADPIEQTLRAVPEQVGLKPKLVFQSVRVATTGSMVSPPLFESLELLGKEVALERIDAALTGMN